MDEKTQSSQKNEVKNEPKIDLTQIGSEQSQVMAQPQIQIQPVMPVAQPQEVQQPPPSSVVEPATVPPQPIQPVEIIDEVVAELNRMAQKYGIRYSQMEPEYLALKNRPDIARMSPADQKKYIIMIMDSKFAAFASTPLMNYELFVMGVFVNNDWGQSWIVGRSYIPGKDPQDLYNDGFGIPTVVTNREDNYLEVQKLQPFTFWRANLSQSQPGVPRRDLQSSKFSTFEYIAHPEVSGEQIEAFKGKYIPLVNLAQVKKMPSGKTIPNPKGGNPWTDRTDIYRMIVTLKSARNGNKNNREFWLYSVVDSSLTEDEKVDKKDPTTGETRYGGKNVNVPKHIYDSLNLDTGSVVEIIFNFRRALTKKGREFEGIEALSVIPIVVEQKKKPVVQQTTKSGAPMQVQSMDLAKM